MAFELDPSYKQVPERIADFKAKHPEGCLRPADPLNPYRVEAINGTYYVVFVAAAYRTPDDPCPGIGTAWELVPGKTPYTKDSELMNAETSAWGRAIVAVLASESKSVSSGEDVRNRQVASEYLMNDAMREHIIEYLNTQDEAAKRRFGKAFGKRVEWTTLQLDAMVAWTEKECAVPLQVEEDQE